MKRESKVRNQMMVMSRVGLWPMKAFFQRLQQFQRGLNA